jgi:multidrug resistance protein, MATE family
MGAPSSSFEAGKKRRAGMVGRWEVPNGYRDVLKISLPLVASMASVTVMQFTDRLFLSHYSVEAISAALPAGIASFTFLSFFMGTAGYLNTFVAQYTGAGNRHRVGVALWQGIYFSLGSGLLLAFLYFAAPGIFSLVGHSSSVQALEVVYFRILILGACLPVLSSAVACFYTGRGRTRTVMFVHIFGAAINIPLDYCLINGVGVFPEMGIAGAGVATVTASGVIAVTLCLLVFGKANRRIFGTWPPRDLDRGLFLRFMRYGLPSGCQFFLEIFGFTFLIQMLGRLGDLELAASSIVFSIESLSFLPMVGFHVGTATLVGQAVGRGRPEEGSFATVSALHLTAAYMFLVSMVFVFAPEPLLNLFKHGSRTVEEFSGVMNLGVVLMRFVALFCFFDAMNLVFSGALKGAGDTSFIMWAIAVVSVGVMIIPVYLAIEVFSAGLYVAWALATGYVCALGVVFMIRYRQGKWKTMRVIESQPLKTSSIKEI